MIMIGLILLLSAELAFLVACASQVGRLSIPSFHFIVVADLMPSFLHTVETILPTQVAKAIGAVGCIAGSYHGEYLWFPKLR